MMTIENQPSSRLNARAFTAIVCLISGLGLPITGYANHLLQFEAMTVTRHMWMAAHNGLGLLFTICAAWHVILNRKALWLRLKGDCRRLLGVTQEAIWACAAIAFVLLVMVGHVLLLAAHTVHSGGPQ